MFQRRRSSWRSVGALGASWLCVCLWTVAAQASGETAKSLTQQESSPQDALSAQDPDAGVSAEPIHPWDGNDFTDTTGNSDPGLLRRRPKTGSPPDETALDKHELDKPATAGHVPERIGFIRNLPNPFNAETRIDFALGQPGRARLEVYNLLGQLQDRVEWSHLEAGVHSWLWQGRSADGQALPSGVYFYRIEVEQSSAMGRMVLLK